MPRLAYWALLSCSSTPGALEDCHHEPKTVLNPLPGQASLLAKVQRTMVQSLAARRCSQVVLKSPGLLLWLQSNLARAGPILQAPRQQNTPKLRGCPGQKQLGPAKRRAGGSTPKARCSSLTGASQKTFKTNQHQAQPLLAPFQ